MNGAPANPISGVPPSSDANCCTDSVVNGTSAGVTGRTVATPAASRIGSATTGPTPGLISMSNPAAFNGSTRSE